MKKIISILYFIVIAFALQAQEFQVGDLYYTITSHTAPYTVEVSKLSKKSQVTTLDIPEKVDYNGTTYTVTSLGEEAFKKSKFLTSVTISNTVAIIGNRCFEVSRNLKIVNLPDKLTDIGQSAFNGCTSLTTITIPDSVTSLFGTFANCKSLESVTLSDNLKKIGTFTFFNCMSLKSIVIPNSVTEIDWGAFGVCKSLKKMIYQGTPQQWQQIKKDDVWDDGSDITIAYAPILDKVQSVQQPLLAQDKSQVPVVENTPVSTVTLAPQSITQPKVMSAVDRNIPQTNLRNENTFVVIIANENYEQVASVPYAINDGKIFQQYCERTLGIPHQNIKTYIDATYNHIRAAQSWLQKICEVFEDERVIFYYAGHGIPDESSRTAYLLPVDGIGTDVTTGYKLDNLYAALGNIPAKNVTVFMDACFSGSKRENGMLASARGVAIKARSGMPQGNMVVFSAAQGDETAYPNNDEKHGMFTYFLLKKLQETAGDATMQELGEYITKNVSQQSILLNGKSQTPCVTPSASLDASWREWKLK